LLSVTRGEKGTPESSYPLSHIRQDERAGRDSQEAFAQRASEKGKGGGRCPATTTAALLDGSRPPIREDQIPGPIPRTRHQDAGRRIPHSDNREATRTGPFEPKLTGSPRRIRNPGPVLSLPSSAAKKSTHHRTRDDNRGATRQVPASNPRRSDSESHPSRSSSRRGMAHPSPSREIPHSDNREATKTGPFEPNPRGARVVRNPGPVLSLPSSAAKNQPTADRTAKSTSGGSGPVASSRSTRFHMLSAGSNFPLSSL